MKLTDIFEATELHFLEAKDKKVYLGTLKIPLAQADVKNKNGRIYSSNLLKREMKCMDANAKKGLVAGMLDHDVAGLVKLEKISHAFTGFEFDEKEKMSYGTAKILNTSKGRDLHVLLDAVPLGASIVGTGTLAPDGAVMDNYTMQSADIVANPSSGIMISGKNLMESLNTVVARHENPSENEDTPASRKFLMEELRLAGYSKPKPEKKKEEKKEIIVEGMSAEELRIAGGPRIIQ